MNSNGLLDLLENNARLTYQDLADILQEDEKEIKKKSSIWKMNGSSADIIRSSTTIKR